MRRAGWLVLVLAIGCALVTPASAQVVTGSQDDPANPLGALEPHFPGKAKRVIYLHMIGAPSQGVHQNDPEELRQLNIPPVIF